MLYWSTPVAYFIVGGGEKQIKNTSPFSWSV